MYLTDALTRAYQSQSPTDTQRSETERDVESIHTVHYLAISEQQLNETKQETAKDPNLQNLKKVILGGWPENSSSVPNEVSEYFNIRDELSVQDGIILQCSVISQTLRWKVKDKIHRAQNWWLTGTHKPRRSNTTTSSFHCEIFKLLRVKGCTIVALKQLTYTMTGEMAFQPGDNGTYSLRPKMVNFKITRIF